MKTVQRADRQAKQHTQHEPGRPRHQERKWGENMTEKQYREEIRKACVKLGVHRPEFSRTRCRLAQIYVRIEELNRDFRAGVFDTTCISHSRNGDVEVIDPHIQELDRLNDQALTYEKALGLTAEAARKINEAVFTPPKPVDPLAQALESAGFVMLNE